MTGEFSYRDYVSDDAFEKKYSSYQERYVNQARESDKVIIDLVRNIVTNAGDDKELTLLDIGCSTGNLLFHLKQAFPVLTLAGGDMMSEVIDKCRAVPELSRIRFEKMNILDLNVSDEFDIITINAVLYMLKQEEFDLALANITKALKKNGRLIAFDFFHEFEQDLSILEKSRSHPNGLMLHFRPYSKAAASLGKNGFADISFNPFLIPVDLIKNTSFAGNQDGFEDLNSYTVKAENGKRLLFRGTLFQPWCHLTARKGP